MAKLVNVYDKDGQPHKKSLPNARDLVTHAGWTWKPGHRQLPTNGQPYAGIVRDTNDKQVAQNVLDRVRHPSEAQGSAMRTSYEEMPTPQITFEEVDDSVLAAEAAQAAAAMEAAEAADEASETGEAEAPAEAPKPHRRPKAGA